MASDSAFGALPTFGLQPAGTTGNTSYGVPQSTSGDVWAGAFDRLGAQVGEWAQTAVTQEAKTAGAIAGLDPNYRPEQAPSWDWTMRGQAFRAAASVTYGNQLEAKTRDAYGQVYHDWSQLDGSQRDPDQLRKNLEAARDGLLKNDVFPQMQGSWTKTSDDLISYYTKAGIADADKRTLDDATASGIQNRNSTLETAYRLSSIPNQDPKIIDAQLAQHDAQVDQAVDAGQMTAVAGQRVKDLARQQIALQRAQTAFLALPDADKAAAAEKFKVDYGQGPQPAGAKPTAAVVGAAILNQESGNNSGVRNSIDGAIGPGQIMPATFARFAQAGERIDSPDDNRRVSQRIVQSYYDKYGGDAARVAVAYFSGEGNVAPAGSPTPWKDDRADGNGKKTSDYVADVQRRLGQPNLSAGLTHDSFTSLQGAMQQEVKRVQVHAQQAQRTAVTEIETVQKQIAAGQDVSPAAWGRLTTQYATSPDPVVRQAFETASGVRGTLAGLKGLDVGEVAARVRDIDATLAAGGASPGQQAMAEAAHKFLDTFRKDVAANPVARFARDHALPSPPVDLSSPASVAASLGARAPLAEAAATAYGQPVRWFTPDERATLKSVAAAGGPDMIAKAAAMAATLGPKLDGALKEIEGDAPKFATAARIAAAGGDPGFLADYAEHQRLLADPATRKQMELPKRDAANAVLRDTLGSALSSIPQMNAAVRTAGVNVYELRAFREGFEKSLTDSAAKAALAKSLQQAAGATFVGDAQYGGIGPAPGARGLLWNGTDRVLAPQNLRADRVGDALSALTEKDIAAVGTPVYGDGATPVPLRTLQGARLVSVAPGKYQVALGDPMGPTPNFVGTPEGRRFVLDLARLEPVLRQRMPAGSWK